MASSCHFGSHIWHLLAWIRLWHLSAPICRTNNQTILRHHRRICSFQYLIFFHPFSDLCFCCFAAFWIASVFPFGRSSLTLTWARKSRPEARRNDLVGLLWWGFRLRLGRCIASLAVLQSRRDMVMAIIVVGHISPFQHRTAPVRHQRWRHTDIKAQKILSHPYSNQAAVLSSRSDADILSAHLMDSWLHAHSPQQSPAARSGYLVHHTSELLGPWATQTIDGCQISHRAFIKHLTLEPYLSKF